MPGRARNRDATAFVTMPLPPTRSVPRPGARALNRVKQAHTAEIIGVAQPTVSRWESGTQDMEPEQRMRVEALVGARPTWAGDATLGERRQRQMNRHFWSVPPTDTHPL